MRFVALLVQGRSSEAIGAIDLMLESAEREGSMGWRSCALSGRAWQRLMIDKQLAEHDVTEVLQDLVDAEIAMAGGIEDSVIAENAYTGVGLGYHQLRLYELALPNYEAAYSVSAHDGRQAGNQAMWQCNLATLHLAWALELYRVHQTAEAAQRSLADSMARSLWPCGIHVALIVIDGIVDLPKARAAMPGRPEDEFVDPVGVAQIALQLAQQSRRAWGFEVEARPFREKWFSKVQ